MPFQINFKNFSFKFVAASDNPIDIAAADEVTEQAKRDEENPIDDNDETLNVLANDDVVYENLFINTNDACNETSQQLTEIVDNMSTTNILKLLLKINHKIDEKKETTMAVESINLDDNENLIVVENAAKSLKVVDNSTNEWTQIDECFKNSPSKKKVPKINKPFAGQANRATQYPFTNRTSAYINMGNRVSPYNGACNQYSSYPQHDPQTYGFHAYPNHRQRSSFANRSYSYQNSYNYNGMYNRPPSHMCGPGYLKNPMDRHQSGGDRSSSFSHSITQSKLNQFNSQNAVHTNSQPQATCPLRPLSVSTSSASSNSVKTSPSSVKYSPSSKVPSCANASLSEPFFYQKNKQFSNNKHDKNLSNPNKRLSTNDTAFSNRHANRIGGNDSYNKYHI
jgi:hypothetical protein